MLGKVANKLQSHLGCSLVSLFVFFEQPAEALPFHKEEENWSVYKENWPKIDTNITHVSGL
jgi:hypothetical protein